MIGGGRMGEALVGGLIGAGWAPADITVVERAEDRRRYLTDRFPGAPVEAEPPAAEGVVIAVKPDDVEEACRAVAGAGVERALSIAAGVRLAQLESWMGQGVPVVRAMPNTPALVGEAASAIAAGRAAGPEDLRWAEEILSAVGRVVTLPEHLLDAATGLSGSGPAYVFLMAEALIDAGVQVGLPRDASVTLVVQTLVGSARLLQQSGEAPEALRAAVTSPGGTTAAGLRVLEAMKVRSAVLEAVVAATERSRQLGWSGT
jgi:pyrroline-5-carboxylate reductase